MKRRIKKLFILLLFAGPILYFVFTLLFFSPFEETFGRVEYIIPRKVDFFLTKKKLDQDIADFPVPALYRDLEVNREWRAFAQTDLYRDLSAELDLGNIIDEIRASLSQIPIDPVADILGEEVAVIGSLKPQGDAPCTYLAFFRASTRVKFFYELFTWNWVRGFMNAPELDESQFFTEPEGFHALVLADNRELFMRRESDLIIVGDDEALMREVSSLLDAGESGIDLSLGGTNAYADKVAGANRLDDNFVDFHLDLERIFQQAAFDDEWRANDIDFAVMNAVDIFDPAFLRSITGALHMGDTLDLEAKVDFYTEEVKEADTGFFSLQSVSMRDQLEFLTGMLPRDVYLAGSIRVDPEKVLKIMDGNMSPDLKKLINDLLREGRRFNTQWNVMETWDLIDRFASTFGDMVSFALRPRDADKPLIPGVQPLPIIAVMFEIKNMTFVQNMEDTLRELQNSNRHEFEMWKYKNMFHNCMIKGITTPGADDIEQVAYTVLEDRYFILATSASMIEDMLKARASDTVALRTDPKYQSARAFVKGHGNLACYLDTVGLKWALHDYAEFWAEINSMIDFEMERPTARARVLKDEFPRYARSRELPANIEKQVVERVDSIMEELALQREEEELPRLTEEFRKHLAWIDLLESATVLVNVNLNDFDISVRLSSPLFD